jgi:DNA-binding transcriptional MerR regulator
MSKRERDAVTALPISIVERETGLSKDVLRKWELRYGFPLPERDAAGERIYPIDQVTRLRLIKRLLDTGIRPARIVSKTVEELAQMVERQQPVRVETAGDGFEAGFLQVLRNHDTPVLRQNLNRLLHREGLRVFVQDRMAGLISMVGEAWARGELDIFEEHLFSEVVQGTLRSVIDGLNDGQGRPRLIFTSLPGEPHGLGLLMAATLAALEEAYCLLLGTQTPAEDIRDAVEARAIDVVALSFSSSFPARRVGPALAQLREVLPAKVDVWIGGDGAVRAARPENRTTLVASLADLAATVAGWRAIHLQ